MVRVIEKQIDVTFSAASTKMLLVQPYLELHKPSQEPFPLSNACNQRLLDAIDKVFEYVEAQRPHFVLFPEFAIPGIAGVERIAATMATEAVSPPTVAIGGVSGLSKDEYRHLCAMPNVWVDADNDPEQIQDSEWVNASVTLVKDNTGALSMFVQPKISPSWPETLSHYQSMFKGRSVSVFRATFDNQMPCRFLSLLCFDWVGRENGAAVPDAVLTQFDGSCRAAGSPQDLQWIFVLQYNQQPNHVSFLTATNHFLVDTTYPFARRQESAVVMVCSAASTSPTRGGGGYGYCGLIFGPRAPFDTKASLPTVATQSERLRGSAVLGTCKDAVFREMGECIHVAEVRIPHAVQCDVTDRTPAIVKAMVMPLNGSVVDPRIPGDSVPAIVKWANDELDDIPDVCSCYFSGMPLEPILRASHTGAVNEYRNLRSQDLAIRIDGACAARLMRSEGKGDPAADIDTAWDVDERNGLRHVIQSVSLIGGGTTGLVISRSQLHGRIGDVEIAAIQGETHPECVRAFKQLAERTHAPILLISRDRENAKHSPRETETFADPRSGAGVKLTDSPTILDAARSRSVGEYAQFITELLNVGERRII